jgi:hypothetical protein
VLVSNALSLLRIALVSLILPLASLKRIAFRMLSRFRLMMESLRKPVGVAARRLSARREKHNKPREHNQYSRTIPHSELLIESELLRQLTHGATRLLQVQVIDQIVGKFAAENKALRQSISSQLRQNVTFW